ncbi:hypothetical protein FS837_001465 [Tulasnella sp. UAMH 9824]|nr:hypothetical protein FS837_001465 [Tulasnella sp. UAMH 9824]
MQQFDPFYRDAELWLIELSNNGPPNMESYGSIIDELDAIIGQQERLRLPESSASQEWTDPGPSTSALTSAPRRLLNSPEGDTPRILQNRAHVQETVPFTMLGPKGPEVSKGIPIPVTLPPLCISKPYRPSTDSAKKIHTVITTLHGHANSLEFIGQLGEAERTRNLVVWSAIPLFILLEFVQETKSPLEKAIKLLANVHASRESLTLDIAAQLRDISDLARTMSRRSMDWGNQMEKKIEAALSREEESSVVMGLKYLKRRFEKWKVSSQMAGNFLLLAGIIQGGVTQETQTAIMSAITLAWATANAVNAAGEVAQIRDRKVENCHGRMQDFAFPSMESLITEFRDILKKVDPKNEAWPQEASVCLTRLANELYRLIQYAKY